MGTFGGHALPGAFFVLFAIWWTIQISVRYFRAKYRKGPPYRSTITFPCSCLCGKLTTWQVEGFLKIFSTTAGITVELIAADKDENGRINDPQNGQHATMYFVFGLTGIVDIMMHHKVSLPKNSDYMANIVAFSVEAILFNFHLHGRSPLNTQMHILLVYTIVVTVLTGLAEMRWPSNVACAYARSFFVLLQGTWFWQIALTLYNPVPGSAKWDEDDQEQMMLIPILFSWHIIAIAIFMLITMLTVNCLIRRGAPPCVGGSDQLPLAQLIKIDANGQTFVDLHVNIDTDSESGENEGLV